MEENRRSDPCARAHSGRVRLRQICRAGCQEETAVEESASAQSTVKEPINPEEVKSEEIVKEDAAKEETVKDDTVKEETVPQETDQVQEQTSALPPLKKKKKK